MDSCVLKLRDLSVMLCVMFQDSCRFNLNASVMDMMWVAVVTNHNVMLCVYVSGELSVQGQRPAGDQQYGQVHCWFHGC